MNLFPYSPGAFMVIPYAHKSDLSELSDETWRQMSAFVRVGVGVFAAHNWARRGVNIGMNPWRGFWGGDCATCALSSGATLVWRYKFYHDDSEHAALMGRHFFLYLKRLKQNLRD